MKLNSTLATAVTVAGLATVAGCGTTPGATTPTGNASIQGRLFFSANQPSQDPGQALTVGLRQQIGGTWSRTTTTTNSTNQGNFSFQGLGAGTYQVLYDDSGKVADSPQINTTGVAVSDPVTITANQTSAPQVNMDLTWSLAGFTPAPSSTVTGRNISFTWTGKPGVSGATYQVSVFGSPNTGSGAIVSSSEASGTSATLALPSSVPAGTVYYVVKYWKSGGSFGGGNFYGQTKPIPITVPAP